MRRFISLAGGLLLAGSLGCSNPTSIQGDFTVAHERWLQVAPALYEITESAACFCGPESARTVTLVVRNGVIESGRYMDTGEFLSSSEVARHHTVDDMFNIIASANARSSGSVVAQYDADVGFPKSVSIDAELKPLDGGVDYYMSNFRRLID